MMGEPLSMQQIVDEWRAEGRTYRPRDVIVEFKRRGLVALREIESGILVEADQPRAGPHLLEEAQQIRDHRDAGQYTTQGNLPD